MTPHYIDFHSGALLSEAQNLVEAEKNFVRIKKQFRDRYSSRMVLAFDVMEYIEEFGSPHGSFESQDFGGFELCYESDTGKVTSIWFWSDVDPWDYDRGGDARHEHGMDIEEFTSGWRDWYAVKTSQKNAIEDRLEEEDRMAAENAERIVEDRERAEYERLREKFE